MKRVIRILSFILLPLVQSGLLYALFAWPEYALYILAGLAVTSDILLFGVIPQTLSYSERFMITWPPLAMGVLVGGMLVFLDIEYETTRYIFIALNALLQAIYLTHLYHRYYHPDRYQARSLERAADYMNTLSVCGAALIAFALIFFLNFSTWYLLPPVALIFFLCTLQGLWVHGLSVRKYYHVLMGVPIILLEAVYVLLWLPSIYYVNALVVALLYTNLTNLTFASIRKELTRREVITSVVLSGAMLVLLLVTTRWR